MSYSWGMGGDYRANQKVLVHFMPNYRLLQQHTTCIQQHPAAHHGPVNYQGWAIPLYTQIGNNFTKEESTYCRRHPVL
jgi:hypothetical protein